MHFSLLYAYFIASVQTGAPYSKRGNIAPLSGSAFLLLLCNMAKSGRCHSSRYILQHVCKQTRILQWFTKKITWNCQLPS